jgi:hypothetical protein
MTWSRSLRFLLLAPALCTAAAGCGGSSTSLATADAARLHRDVASIRAAASGHNPAAAHAAVRTLEADVSRLRSAGRLAPADASVLLADAGQVDRKVPRQVTAPAAQATPTAPATVATPQGPHGKGNGHGNGNGDGDGGDGGDGGD